LPNSAGQAKRFRRERTPLPVIQKREFCSAPSAAAAGAANRPWLKAFVFLLQGRDLAPQVGDEPAMGRVDPLDRRQGLLDFLAGQTGNFRLQFFHHVGHVATSLASAADGENASSGLISADFDAIY
jgi:hypothetical protein